jgi:hypothetical protein
VPELFLAHRKFLSAYFNGSYVRKIFRSLFLASDKKLSIMVGESEQLPLQVFVFACVRKKLTGLVGGDQTGR